MNVDFSGLLSEFKKDYSSREEIFLKARGIIRESKRVIYSVHRDDFGGASKGISVMKKKLGSIKKKKVNDGVVKVAFQEFVEAVVFYEFCKNKKFPSAKSLGVGSEEYLLGVCDLSGELVRRAINKVFEGDYKELLEVKRLLGKVYGELLKFDVRNGDLRRKFDKVKYDLIKIEEICLDLKLRGGCKSGRGKCQGKG